MVLNIDADVSNADWVKQGVWNLPVSNAAELYVFLAERAVTVAHFKTLPVYKSNVGRMPWLDDIAQPPLPGIPSKP